METLTAPIETNKTKYRRLVVEHEICGKKNNAKCPPTGATGKELKWNW